MWKTELHAHGTCKHKQATLRWHGYLQLGCDAPEVGGSSILPGILDASAFFGRIVNQYVNRDPKRSEQEVPMKNESNTGLYLLAAVKLTIAVATSCLGGTPSPISV